MLTKSQVLKVRELTGMTNTSIVNLNSDLVGLWRSNLDILNGQILACFPCHCGLYNMLTTHYFTPSQLSAAEMIEERICTNLAGDSLFRKAKSAKRYLKRSSISIRTKSVYARGRSLSKQTDVPFQLFPPLRFLLCSSIDTSCC